ncbi:MAG: hypothetical protein ACR2IK_02130 [Chloroflexota bacterium]
MEVAVKVCDALITEEEVSRHRLRQSFDFTSDEMARGITFLERTLGCITQKYRAEGPSYRIRSGEGQLLRLAIVDDPEVRLDRVESALEGLFQDRTGRRYLRKQASSG